VLLGTLAESDQSRPVPPSVPGLEGGSVCKQAFRAPDQRQKSEWPDWHDPFGVRAPTTASYYVKPLIAEWTSRTRRCSSPGDQSRRWWG